eukprot:CAMPEP_0117737090 /NCGR_PEP_ID=MMETSP0947-20121206/2320_1 /TAXON_ID=44440 /ORGANISM="Chattonella subsalsa, Strain CCMP2191" /LENGTH=361 /DNA_ID=CAMNT_0005552509 /DNA_START=24 /DNA_END=1109 /DNA_ORIENTATION=+
MSSASIYQSLPRGFIPVALYGVLVAYVAPNLFGLVSLVLMMFNVGYRKPPKQAVSGSVFVTGADSGLGKAAAISLAKAGYHVFAGCLTEKAKDNLVKALKDIEIKGELEYIRLDITNTEQIQKAADQVRKALKKQQNKNQEHPGLVGIVHCAGVNILAPGQYASASVYKQVFNINFHGPINLTQALFPFIEDTVLGGKGRCRIIFVGGEGPSSLWPAPALNSPYYASVSALEAYCQSLRMEMNLKHVLIESTMVYPGLIHGTAYIPKVVKLSDEIMKTMPSQAESRYKKLMLRFLKASASEKGNTEEKFVKTIESIIRCAVSTKPFYMVGGGIGLFFQSLLPDIAKEYIWSASRFNPKFDK